MTQNANTAAPAQPPAAPPGPFVAPQGASQEPNQDDRLLSAAAYLSVLLGFWFIAPIAIFILKRDKSRFVAHHALRALALHILWSVVSVAGGVMFMVLGIVAAAALSGPHGSLNAAGGLFTLLMFAGFGLPALACLLSCIFGALSAGQGKSAEGAFLGGMVERFLGPKS